MSDVEVSVDQSRGFRGEVGTSSAGDRLKVLHSKTGKGVPLKRFVRELLKEGNVDAKKWFADKRGASNKKRSDANVKRVQLEAAATKQSRKKVKK